MCRNAYEMAEGADALVLVTPWNEFKQIDMAKIRDIMNQPILIDGKNVYEPEKMREMGFEYRAVGRGYEGAGVGNGERNGNPAYIPQRTAQA
jgi:UDPglucose 6-dehydrogenase